MANSIIGLTTDLTDRERSLKFLGLSRGAEELAEIRHLKAGEFYVSGTSIRVKKFGTMTVSEKSIRIKSELKQKPKSEPKPEEEKKPEPEPEPKMNPETEIRILKERVHELEGLLKGEYARGWNDGCDTFRNFDKNGLNNRTLLERVRGLLRTEG